MNFSARNLIAILQENGYVFRRSNGSHHIFYHPEKKKLVVVPMHGKKDLPRGTFYAILKQAGIDTPAGG